MDHGEKLREVYNRSFFTEDIVDIPADVRNSVGIIASHAYKQKGVYTVLITLVTHKILHPSQDVRYHQSTMPGGFSGRSVDTQYITPALKALGLPSMAESGWLTRSLEQPFPYTMEYGGHISSRPVKRAFLATIDYVQKHPGSSEDVLRLLLNRVIELQKLNVVEFVPLSDPEKLTIALTEQALASHFAFSYRTHGGAKLPVIALYVVYQFLIKEFKRYQNCRLAPLGSHTASDRTSRTSGDIEVFRDSRLLEVVEIKMDRKIDQTIVRIAVEKIVKFNPHRYYILSDLGVKPSESSIISDVISRTKRDHGCQIILNGVLPTIRYYLRLISSVQDFLVAYSSLVGSDGELQRIHKEQWNHILSTLT